MVAVHYDWDELEDNIDEEYDDSGNTIAEYTTEPSQFGDLISQRRSADSRFYCFDGLGSTLALTDPVANVSDNYAYTAFGESTERTGSTLSPFQYLGEASFWTSMTLRTLNSRFTTYADPLARWLSHQGCLTPDTLGSCIGRNYLLAANHPTATGASQGTKVTPPKDACLPVVPPPKIDTTFKCAIAPHGKTAIEDAQLCVFAKEFGGPDTLCGACTGDDIVAFVRKNICCNLLIDGHRGSSGGYHNPGGIANYLCEVAPGKLACPRYCRCAEREDKHKCSLLPDSQLGKALGKLFEKYCSQCVVTIRACGSGDYAKPLIALAQQTGCIVCGYPGDCPFGRPEPNPLNDSRYRCVNTFGRQVGDESDPNLKRFCYGEAGSPKNVNRPPPCKKGIMSAPAYL